MDTYTALAMIGIVTAIPSIVALIFSIMWGKANQ